MEQVELCLGSRTIDRCGIDTCRRLVGLSIYMYSDSSSVQYSVVDHTIMSLCDSSECVGMVKKFNTFVLIVCGSCDQT